MIPSYDLMYEINKECISYLQSVWGNDECESCTYEEIYSNLMEEVCDGALDIPLYAKESKEYYKTNRDVNFNKYMLDILLKIYDGRVETYPLLINDTFSYAVYSLFHEDSGYQIYDATLEEVYDIISEVMDIMVTSFNFIDFDEDIFNVVDNLRKLSVIVNSCDKKEGEKMKVVHTKETELVRSNDAKNLMLAKDLALEFIDSGYDVIMRDGDDLVVYSNTDTSMQEYVPKSLHKVFYDVDKLDLLPLSYYVYMCK